MRRSRIRGASDQGTSVCVCFGGRLSRSAASHHRASWLPSGRRGQKAVLEGTKGWGVISAEVTGMVA